MNKNITTQILWAVFFALLAVLLPHTAWAFRQFEPEQSMILIGSFDAADALSYVVAFAFEAAIAVLVHKLAKRIEEVKPVTRSIKNSDGTFTKVSDNWATFKRRYVHPISFGLLIATLVSGMANLAHAVQFGRAMVIFAQWHIPQSVYSVAFGGILPLVSLTFASVLSNVTDSEDAPNPELDAVKKVNTDLRLHIRELEKKLGDAEDARRTAEERFGALGDLFRRIFSEDKRERIIAVREWRPQLSGSAIAVIAESSPAYVSEVLKDLDTIQV